jgi:RNA polymerase sigma-70 factor (ECF subfamily)
MSSLLALAPSPREAIQPAPVMTEHSTQPPAADGESRAWVAALRAQGAERERAVARLHELLLRAARFEVRRRAAAVPHLREILEDVAQQSADDALVAVLAKLDTFRGDSRFSTWAYKFAVLEAAVAVRRRAWQGREVPLEYEQWPRLEAGSQSGPGEQAETGELLGAVREAIDAELSPRQRDVLVAVTLNGVPIDVLAERLDTTRGALYKTLHDARRKLRERLAAGGFDLSAIDAEGGR